MKKILPFVLVAALAGCGHNPAGPSQPPTPPMGSIGLELLSGETDQPVSATVNVAGTTRSVFGGATFDNVKKGDLIDVVSAGFIDLQSEVKEFGQRTIGLWPDRPGFSRQYTKKFVYWNNESKPLQRPASGTTVYFVADSPIRGDATARNAIREGASVISDVISPVSGGVVFAVSDSPPGGAVVVHIRINPNIPPQYGGWAPAQYQDNVLSGGSIEFREIRYARYWQLIAHEMGHIFGVLHSDRGGMMAGDPSMYSARDFSDAERLAMRMMLRRPPGNHFPDNDRGVTSSHAGVARVEVFCQF